MYVYVNRYTYIHTYIHEYIYIYIYIYIGDTVVIIIVVANRNCDPIWFG